MNFTIEYGDKPYRVREEEEWVEVDVGSRAKTYKGLADPLPPPLLGGRGGGGRGGGFRGGFGRGRGGALAGAGAAGAGGGGGGQRPLTIALKKATVGDLADEAQAMTGLRNNSVLRLLGFWAPPPPPGSPSRPTVLALHPLADRSLEEEKEWRRRRNISPLNGLPDILCGLLSGIDYLMDKKIVHRAINPETVLFKEEVRSFSYHVS